MHRRFEQFERRLARLQAVLRGWAAERERQREKREREELLAALLRSALTHAGVDPDEAVSLRRLETPEPVRRFVHPLRRLAERQRPCTLIEALYEMTRRYHTGPAPDLRQASVMELIGYYGFGAGYRDGAARAAPA